MLRNVVSANAGTRTPRPFDFDDSELMSRLTNEHRWFWVPAFAGTT